MPINYEIETDGLYLEGLEKGIEKTKFDIVSSMLLQKKYTIDDIMVTLKVTEAYIQKVSLEIGIQIDPIS
jgi:hypothetical protein